MTAIDDPFGGVSDDFDQNIRQLGQLKVAGTDYDPLKFYTRASNKFDHSVNVQTPFPKDIVAAMERMVSMGLVPEYTSKHALIRDAVTHRLHTLAEHLGDWETVELIASERIIAAADQRRAARMRHKEIVTSAENDLQELQREGDWFAMDHELGALEAIVDTLPSHTQTKLGQVIDHYKTIVARHQS